MNINQIHYINHKPLKIYFGKEYIIILKTWCLESNPFRENVYEHFLYLIYVW